MPALLPSLFAPSLSIALPTFASPFFLVVAQEGAIGRRVAVLEERQEEALVELQ